MLISKRVASKNICDCYQKRTFVLLFVSKLVASKNIYICNHKILDFLVFIISFLDFLALVLGRSLAAKPSKIVAGHEADKTNEWLQALAEAINKKV